MAFLSWQSQRAEQHPNSTALIFRSAWLDMDSISANQVQSAYWTFAQLEIEVNQWVEFLQDLGIKSGDRVAVLMANQPQYVMLIHALSRCKAIAVFLNTRLTAHELKFQIQDSQAQYLCHDERHSAIAKTLSPIVKIINISNTNLHLYPSSIIAQALEEESIQGIFYTSGTTGQPKAVPLSYNNHWHSAIASNLRIGHNANDNWLLCLPMFHVGGMAIIWRSVISGMTLTLLPKFDEQQVLEAIAIEKVTLISLVPTMLSRLLEHPLWQNLYNLRGILLGGANANSELINRCLQLNLPIMPTYGMTETASQFTTLLPHEVSIKLGSSGRPLSGNQLRIIECEDHAQDVKIGEVGQILVKGKSVMSGYLHSPKQTSQISQTGIDADGWLHTGDLGYLDVDGYLYVVSRRSDLIISGGENIYPAEIEAILSTHPAIADICVVGLEDSKWGEQVAAIAVTSSLITLEEIRRFCEQKSLARYKLPKHLFVWDDLPRNASGKLLRQKIRDRLQASKPVT